MAMIPYILSCSIVYAGLYLVYRLALKVAGKTKVMKKIKSQLSTDAAKAGILAGVLIYLVTKFLQIP